MSKQENVFETRWGYVAYSYEDYKNLKKLNVIFQKARINAARWKRWVRKAPHNRVQKIWDRNELGQKTGYAIAGPLVEPVICELFSEKLVDINRKRKEKTPYYWDVEGTTHYWFDDFVKTDNTVEIEYRKSHKPIANPHEVEVAKWSSLEIKNMLDKAKAWYLSLNKETA